MTSHSFRHTSPNPGAAGLGFKANPLQTGYDKSPCLHHPAKNGGPCSRAYEDKSHYTCANCAILKNGKADCFNPDDYPAPPDPEKYVDGRRRSSFKKKECAIVGCKKLTRGIFCTDHSGIGAARKAQWTKNHGDRPIDLDWLYRPKSPNDKTRDRRGGRPRKIKPQKPPELISLEKALRDEIKNHRIKIKAIRAAIAELKK